MQSNRIEEAALEVVRIWKTQVEAMHSPDAFNKKSKLRVLSALQDHALDELRHAMEEKGFVIDLIQVDIP
jgi:hypothetical protein